MYIYVPWGGSWGCSWGWFLRRLDFWISGFLDLWISESLDLWISGFLDFGPPPPPPPSPPPLPPLSVVFRGLPQSSVVFCASSPSLPRMFRDQTTRIRTQSLVLCFRASSLRLRVVFPHPSAPPPCDCLCLSTYLRLSSCLRRPPCPCVSVCVSLCLSVSVYVSASVFVSPPCVSVRVCVSICLCLALSVSVYASASVFVSAKTLPLAACLSACLCVCLCLSTYLSLSSCPRTGLYACFLSSRAEILRCVGAAEPGRRPSNKSTGSNSLAASNQ